MKERCTEKFSKHNRLEIMLELNDSALENSIDKMSLDEINFEIILCREERQKGE